MTKPKGWRNEPGRHSLASRGISTSNQSAYTLRSRVDQMGPDYEEDEDYYEGSIFNTRMSDSICRACGRRGCEGGAACEMAAEMIDL